MQTNPKYTPPTITELQIRSLVDRLDELDHLSGLTLAEVVERKAALTEQLKVLTA